MNNNLVPKIVKKSKTMINLNNEVIDNSKITLLLHNEFKYTIFSIDFNQSIIKYDYNHNLTNMCLSKK